MPMDYEYYYYESRNRYYDACSEIANCENRANELRSERQRKISYINQLKADLRKHQNLQNMTTYCSIAERSLTCLQATL